MLKLEMKSEAKNGNADFSQIHRFKLVADGNVFTSKTVTPRQHGKSKNHVTQIEHDSDAMQQAHLCSSRGSSVDGKTTR